MISSLAYLIQNRKEKLLTYLNNNADELPLERQHQLYGAITELDSIMEILNQYKKLEIHKETNPEEIFLFKPIHSKGFLKEFKDFFADFF